VLIFDTVRSKKSLCLVESRIVPSSLSNKNHPEGREKKKIGFGLLIVSSFFLFFCSFLLSLPGSLSTRFRLNNLFFLDYYNQ